MNKIKQILILSSLLTIFSSNIAYALNLPEISFDRTLVEKNSDLGQIQVGKPLKYAIFNRFLGFNKTNIVNSIGDAKRPETVRDVNKTGFKLLILELPKITYSYRGIYVLEKTNAIGYCLLEPIRIKGYTDAVLNTIKAFPVNSSYLQGRLNMPPNTTITFYDKQNNGYIERYAIAQTPHDEILLLDAFFPNVTENTIEPYIIESLNKNFTKYSVIQNKDFSC